MDVTLVQKPSMPFSAWGTMYVAARTCYSAKTTKELFHETKDPDNIKAFVKKVLASGHLSIAEHISFSFGIDSISRACSHQLVRHRLCTFSQQSQRYVEIKETKEDIMGILDRYDAEEMRTLVDKYFVVTNEVDTEMCIKALLAYRTLIEDDFRKPEDARAVLPNATKTNLVMTCNLRQLMHISELRLCARAQTEIRQLFHKMKEELTAYDKDLGDLLMAKCDRVGFCTEANCCGKKKRLGDLLNDK